MYVEVQAPVPIGADSDYDRADHGPDRDICKFASTDATRPQSGQTE
jgi:hypothetical protein